MNESKALWSVIELRERYENWTKWIEFQEGLTKEGYIPRRPDVIDNKVIRGAKCPDCSRMLLIPKAFTNSNKEYVLYQLCDWCGYYGEV